MSRRFHGTLLSRVSLHASSSRAIAFAVLLPACLSCESHSQQRQGISSEQRHNINYLERFGIAVTERNGKVVQVSFADLHEPTADADALSRLRTFPDIEYLSLRHTQANNDTLCCVAELANIRFLLLEDCARITDEGVRHLSNCSDLEYLNLSGTQVTDDSFQVIAKLPRLTEVDVSFSDVTGARIGELSCLPNLEMLNLETTNVSDACLDDLCKLRGLRHLNVMDTDISRDGMLQIKRRIPEVAISSDYER